MHDKVMTRYLIAILGTAVLVALIIALASKTEVLRSRKGIKIVADNLEVPWEIALLPSGDLLVTERGGLIREIGGDATKVEGVYASGEGGLLGLTLHPDFENNSWIYLYRTTLKEGRITNVVERYRLDGVILSERLVIVAGIPGEAIHNGGRIAFGPDGYLYIATGDSARPSEAQNTNSLAGKILRVSGNGSIPKDNPFDNAVYSYGHRNPQGLAWDKARQLWVTEHGQIAHDELNRIEKGGNFGWPVVEGDEKREGMISPMLHSGNDTWAPAGLAYVEGKLFFAGLRGEALFEVSLMEEGRASQLKKHYAGRFGRLRAVINDGRGNLLVSTSNRDGRGRSHLGDDLILKIPWSLPLY